VGDAVATDVTVSGVVAVGLEATVGVGVALPT
jgi:hypothetical protein